jgi:uncharacterized SAM-binding protein YcdF (DUF218 family)
MNRFTYALIIALTTFTFIIEYIFLVVVGVSIIHPAVPKVDVVIVLGAKVDTPALTQRTLQGLKYYQTGNTDTLVLSGGKGPGESISEAQAMKDVITREIAKTGVKMPNIILEDQSRNTYQNIHNSKNLIPQAKSVVIVSDCFHLARSVALAKRTGFEQVYWDAPTPSYYQPWDLAFSYFREVIGIIAYMPKLFTN